MARGRPPKCIHCGSLRSTARGVRRTKTLGERKLRVCKDCGRKFTPRNQAFQPIERVEALAADPLLDGPHPDH